MIFVYRFLTTFLYPFFVIIIFFRIFLKKEDKYRYKEKIFSSAFKPNRNLNKKLIWLHASSIGELLSIIPLIDELNKFNKNLEFLVTTVTLSSANLIEKKLFEHNNIIHRFFPVDNQFLVTSFLSAWRPNLVCFVDSEIWPNFLYQIKEREIPLILLNARLTKKTLMKWKIFPKFAKKVFNNFDLCLASSEDSKKNLEQIGVKKINYIGNIKFCAKIKLQKKISDANKSVLNEFNVWCAASTHQGEEEIIIKAHLNLKKITKNIKTIIIPRHINRVVNINSLIAKYKLIPQILNEGELINKKAEIIIINSFGVLEKYFEYCKLVFVGKSLLKNLKNVGGQNPIEAAKVGCKVFHGPYVYNFKEIYEFLNSIGIAIQVYNEQDLSSKLLENFETKNISSTRHIDNLKKYGDKILIETVDSIKNYINIY
jgi:3-deoxy-D-manno-octulosonic-acid transferase